MSIQATCDYCGRTYSVSEKYIGKRLPCKECGELFDVPEEDFDFAPTRSRRDGSSNRSAAPARRINRKPAKRRRKSGPNWLLIGLGGGGGLLALGGLIVVLIMIFRTTHESLAEDMVDATEDLVSIMEGITDESSAKAAVPRIHKIGDRMADILRKGDELEKSDPFTDEEEVALDEKIKERMEAISKRREEQLARLRMIPGALAIVQEAAMEMSRKIDNARREALERRRAERQADNPANLFGG
jgi:hypothetical protein